MLHSLLAAAVTHARMLGMATLLCNAHTPAAPFYRRHGFASQGEPFIVPDAGPHSRMSLRLG